MVAVPRIVAAMVGLVVVVATASAAGLGAGLSLSARDTRPQARQGAPSANDGGSVVTLRATVIRYASIAAKMHRAHTVAAAGDSRSALTTANTAAKTLIGWMARHRLSKEITPSTIALAWSINLAGKVDQARLTCGDCRTEVRLAAREHLWFRRFELRFTPLARRYLGPTYAVGAF